MYAGRLIGPVALVTMALALAGCENINQQLGLAKQPPPDEFKVVSRAPLALPPDYALRPPQPGTPRPQEGTTVDQARSAVFQSDAGSSGIGQARAGSDTGPLSSGEQSFLKEAGASNADPEIRQVVERETQLINVESEDFVETLIFWRSPEKPGVVVDADAEAKRLRENTALGKPVTEGETPTIERREKAIFEGIF